MSARKVSPRKATILTGVVLASTVFGGPALAATQLTAASNVVRAATPTVSTVVSRLSLPYGPSAGGGKLLVSGTKLATAANDGALTAKTVKFGTVSVPTGDVVAVSTSALEVVVPAKGTAAKVSVLVGDATKGPGYTYVAPDVTVSTDQDALDDLAPSSDTGLAEATLAGTNFEPTTRVLIGGLPTKSTATASEITYALPAGLAGVQDVVVSDPRNTVYVGHVEYTAKVPTVTKASSYAVTEASTPVTLTGTNLDAVTAVTFVKDDAAEKVAFAKTTDPTKLVLTVPKGAAKVGEIKVATKYGKTASVALERKASVKPAVTAVDGAVAAGGPVTLTGTNLVGLKSVKVTNATKAFTGTVVAVKDATEATVKLPPMAAGTYDLAATSSSASASEKYSFTVASSTPTASSVAVDAAKTKVTITGTKLAAITKIAVTPASGTAVYKPVGKFVSNADGTSVSVTLTPALADGTYGVVATNAFGSTTKVDLTVGTPAPAPAPAPTLSGAVYTASADSTSGDPELALTGSNLASDTQVRYYAEGDDPSTDSVTPASVSYATSTLTAVLAGDLATGTYKVQVSANGTTWSTASDVVVP